MEQEFSNKEYEQLIKTYLSIIKEILNCPTGEEGYILMANQELVIDDRFLNILNNCVDIILEQGDKEKAAYLYEVAEKVSIEISRKFLNIALQATLNSTGNFKAIYPLLEANLDKLDKRLIILLENWQISILPQLTFDEAAVIAAAILDFSKRLREFPLGNKSDNLEIALVCCQVGQTVFTSTTYSEIWGLAQTILAYLYWERIEEDRAQNLETAINLCQEALKIRSYEIAPQNWAEVQNILGLAYRDRIRDDKAENLELSIIHLKNALQIFNIIENPEQWAWAQHNLATVYSQRIYGNPDENIQDSITCSQKAMQIFTHQAFPEYWARTQMNLGNAYLKKEDANCSNSREIAINCYNNALQILTPETFPEYWALVNNNLGIVYAEYIDKNENNNVEKAIICYEKALQVFTRESFPEKWAMIQINLCNIYYEQGLIQEVIESSLLVLETYTPTSFPFYCLAAARHLGNAASSAELWPLAIDGYCIAIDALEQKRNWEKSEFNRQKTLEDFIGIYESMVQACINAGQIDKAFEYSERSRSKRLVDLMASYNLFQGEEIPPKVQELLQQYEELQRQIDRERQSHKYENNRSETRAAWEAYNEAIASLETQKQQVWENLRREDPVLAGEIQVNHLSLSEIQKLIDQTNTAILSFYTTNSDTHIFVVQQNKITLHTCTGQGLKTLQGWIEQNWLLPYMNDPKKWETQINSILRELTERLQISELISQHLQGIEELILVPHLLLHQIPFAALPTGEYQEDLGDKFLIRYTPSCQILEFCQQRDNVEIFNQISRQYGTVEDAEDNLPCARFEGEQIAQMYNIPLNNRLIGSSQATCKNYRHLAQQVQVLHSSHHAVSRLDNPLESQLKLADGNITLGQLMTPSWRLPKLVEVFLSCCETNLGIPSLTDDILTLATGFLCAGARSVVSSLWVVDDLATALFSIFYYQHRQQNYSRPEALHKAQIQLREFTKLDLNKIFQEVEAKEKELIGHRKKYPSGSIEYEQWKHEYNLYAKLNRRIKEIENSTQQFPFSHPRYWAAFICQGLR
ncbi:CHAT domain-containing protein [Dendronalium sp. ChiSLP03b]|uniref:CHAT domain-containing protein n=1 Tax=Dendronalium sp. ChiSLP03b TaxID=3075381 RepID=UPI002AD22A8F|nr:CHAT domain-containing protein [Dendronalium sp. ChiSLP03b]MDZ8204420.1 CHAT domain-containing protein [Dendronalium sp. ChiSLP03b]